MVRITSSRQIVAENRLFTRPVAVRHEVRSQATGFLQGDPAVLVIPRKSAESIVIGDNIILTIIEVQDDEVRLGIEHPPGVTVHKGEIYQAMCSQQANRNTGPPSAPQRTG
jgi:carbon storage regulator